MIKIAICDDNLKFSQIFYKKIKSITNNDCMVLPPFFEGTEVIEYLKINSINILFLDIDMPKINGFDLAKILCEKYPDIIIIFVSAYEDFVYSSFEYCPFRFLRKSHLNDELKTTLEKAIEKIIINDKAKLFFINYSVTNSIVLSLYYRV